MAPPGELPLQPIWGFNGITPGPLIVERYGNLGNPGAGPYWSASETICRPITVASVCRPSPLTFTMATRHSGTFTVGKRPVALLSGGWFYLGRELVE